VRFCIHQATCSRGTQALITSVLLTLGLLSGLDQPAAAPAQQTCAAGEARSVVGQPYSQELAERARRTAGAREVRKIEPGGAYTTDLNAHRLNVEVDRAGIVRDLRCG
jgi:peptidase inhibitor I78 family protein